MKKPTPVYMFIVLISLTITGFAFFTIFINMGKYSLALPPILIFGVVSFFMYIARKMNTGQFGERLNTRTTCFSCMEEIPSESEFCPKCGVNLTEKVECDYCGYLNPVDASECAECNANLK